jgi:L-arabinonolactonase
VEALHLNKARRFVEDADALGECPVWDEIAQRLWWIDVTGKRISSCDASGSRVQRRLVSDFPGSIRLRASEGLIVAYRRGIALYDGHGEEVASAPLADDVVKRERFNDGACDALGRYWVGTMDRHLRDPIGGLYRIDADLSMHRMSEGLCISNGIAWSPDNTKLYQCDSAPVPRIWVHDFDLRSGIVSNRRLFVEYPPDSPGGADGCAVDSQGSLWVASPRAGKILCFNPTGCLIRELRTPMLNPTAVAFGGETLCTMFITSMQAAAISVADWDGAVVAVDVGVPGRTAHRFAG